MEKVKITTAFCPVCGNSILDRVRNIQEKTLRKQKEFYEGMRSLLMKPNPSIKLNEREQKEFNAYFAGTKISEKTVRCSHCHDDKRVTINDVTGDMTGFDLVPKTPAANEVVTRPVMVVSPKNEIQIIPKEEPKRRVPVIVDEDFFLYVQHYPGIPSHYR